MDYFEIKNRFEEIGKGEIIKGKMIDEFIIECSQNINKVDKNNRFYLAAIPKFLLDNYFNSREKLEEIQSRLYSNSIIRYGKIVARRSNRFMNELVFNGVETMSTLNFYYNGIVIQMMPIDLFEKKKINASAIYYYIYHFLNIIIEYYKFFNFMGIIDLEFDLKGIKDREFIYLFRKQPYPDEGSLICEEEINKQTITLDIEDLESQKVEIAKSFLVPLYYSHDYEKVIGVHNEEGLPIYKQ